jgi:hypothetical protein
MPTPGQKRFYYNSVVTHVLYHLCNLSLINPYMCRFILVSCCLRMYFLRSEDTVCLLINRKMIKIVTLIESDLDYDFGNDNNIFLTDPRVIFFFIYPINLLLTQNFVHPCTLFSSVPPPPPPPPPPPRYK